MNQLETFLPSEFGRVPRTVILYTLTEAEAQLNVVGLNDIAFPDTLQVGVYVNVEPEHTVVEKSANV